MKLLVSLILILSLTGCAHFAHPNLSVFGKNSPGTYTIQQYTQDLTNYSKTNDIGLRNKMVYSLIGELDNTFYQYEAGLFVHSSAFNIGSHIVQMGLGATATITKSARTKTVIASVLLGATGIDLSVNKNLFGQQTLQAISSSMESNRDHIKVIILTNLQKTNEVYPFAAARIDLIKYLYAGTLQSGLEQLNQQSASTAKEQRTNVEQVTH